MPTQPDPVTAGLIVGVLTLICGFGAWAIGHWLFLRLAPESLRKLPGWREYRAAFWGDLLILPAINGLIVWMLYQLPFDPVGAYFLPILAALTITIFIHLEQAFTKRVNWTMPRPWRWNSFGFYHALFMAINLTIVFFFLDQLWLFWPYVIGDSRLLLALIGILAGWLGMLLLFFLDRLFLPARQRAAV